MTGMKPGTLHKGRGRFNERKHSFKREDSVAFRYPARYSRKTVTKSENTTASAGNAKRTILITGLNGYLAGRAAELVLREGYRVRGTVRNRLAGEDVKAALCCLGYRADDIEVIEIPDICRQDDLNLAARGCSAIFHLAAPMAEIWTLPPSEVVRITVDSTAVVLNAAMDAGRTMKSVVFLSSAAALFDLPMEDRLYTERDWNTTSERIFEQKGEDTGGFHAYLASKTKAEKLFWKFRDDHKPSFAMTALQPTYFIGPPLIPWKTPKDIPYSNQHIWSVVAGEDIPGPLQIYGDTIDIRDVARMLVWSVSNRKADGQRFVCSSAVGGGQAVADILAKRMPAIKIQRGQPGQGYSADFKPRTSGVAGFDASKAVSMTGRDWIPYEESIVDMAKFLRRYIVIPST
ncbi:hypothetical protein F4861DRAFT_534313 [Xylaria intraflava]|nr:hypothetical protein F4861DRAFT_534313 [Xylaria intraflava]